MPDDRAGEGRLPACHADVPFALPRRPAAIRIRERDKAALLASHGPRTMAMAGYEPAYTDIVDYIVRITEQIWTDRAIDRIGATYAPDCVVVSPYGTSRTAGAVVTATRASLAAFPEDEAHHLNVAWIGDDQRGFYTSHLGWSRMVNQGASAWGPATGRAVERRFAADCISLANRIHTEWLVSDEGLLVRGLGLTIDEAAAVVAGGRDGRPLPLAPELPSPPSGASELNAWIGAFYHQAWTRHDASALSRSYATEVAAHWPGGREAHDAGGVAALIAGLLASILDLVMGVEHVCWSEESDGVIVAVRWRLRGTTRAGGLLGDALPEGRAIAILGISHHRFVARRIVEEWVVFDEVAAVADALTADTSR